MFFNKQQTNAEIKSIILIKTILVDGRKYYTSPEFINQISFPNDIKSQSNASIYELFRLNRQMLKQPKPYINNNSMSLRQQEHHYGY